MAQLRRIVLKGYKSIKEMDLTLRPINVLIGPNGVGKSNLISFFRLLHDIVERRLQQHVVKSGGGDRLLHYGVRTTREIDAELYFGNNGYMVKLEHAAEDTLIIGREHMYWEYAGVKKGIQYNARESGALQAYNDDPSGIPGYVVPSIQRWVVYHFHDTSASAPVKQTGDLHDNRNLRRDGANLAAYLYLLQEKHLAHYDLIRATIRQVFPLFGDFALRPNPLAEDTIRLEWFEAGSDYAFGPHQLSDGTLRFMCLATLLLQPQLPDTILIDEPELGLHPSAIEALGALIRSASRKSQVILSTQSISLLNQFEPEDVITVDRIDGASTFTRHTREELAGWLEDYSLADIWEKNIIGGKP